MRSGIVGIERSIDKKQQETGREVTKVSGLLFQKLSHVLAFGIHVVLVAFGSLRLYSHLNMVLFLFCVL